MLRNNLIWSHGTLLLLVLAGAAMLSYIFFQPLLYVCAVLFLFCLYFFRNPDRHCPEAQYDSAIIVSPADGKVMEITQLDEDEYGYKIAIFMSPLDVHVNRIPNHGTIEHSAHRPGKFYPAYVPKSSEFNEAHDIVVVTNSGKRYKLRQIAGMLARRIVWWVNVGDRCVTGQPFGMIKFSSRVDLWLPHDVELSLVRGQQVYAGRTVVGRFTSRPEGI